MRLRATILALPFAALMAALAPIPLAAQSALDSASSSSQRGMSFGDALNAYRAQSGLGGLREDRQLARAAQAFAEDMATHGYFSHTGRDGSSVSTRARAAGCGGRGYFAENIAWGQRSANDAFQGWVASAGHRANMLGRPYGVYGLGQSGGYWVLVFADGC